jgi:HEAT repeat protein
MKSESLSGLISPGLVAVLPVTDQGVGSADDLVSRIKSKDDAVRGPAWQSAEIAGAAAVKPLSEVMVDPDFEIARAARRALYRIVRHAGRPGAMPEAKAVAAQLIPLLKSPQALVRKEAAWMLSEIAGDEAVKPMSALLSDQEAREDARCALMRFPGSKATSAFKTAFKTAQEDFKPALAETLRERGVEVKGYPSQKIVPSRKTEVGASAGS